MPVYETRGDTYNVRDYGAVGDGTVDDTTAIQAALTAAGAANGGTVWMPAGRYRTTSSLAIPSFTRLTGPGFPRHSSEITGGDPTTIGASIVGDGSFHMIVNSDTTNGNTGIEIDHLKIAQPASISGDWDIFRGVRVWRSFFHDLDLVGQATTNRKGINLASPSEENLILHCRLEGCGIATNGNALTALQNDIGGTLYGIRMTGGFGHRVIANHIYNASINGIAASTITGCTIDGNHVEDGTGSGHGVSFTFAVQDCVITNNIIKNTLVYSGLVLDSSIPASPSTNNLICGNQVFSNAAWGIAIISGSGSQTNNNLVADNSLRNNGSGAIVQTAGLLNNIRGNVGYNPVGHAVTQPAVPATTVAQTNTTGVDCAVFVNGGTVTVVAIGGSTTGQTGGMFRVPAGQTITLTYSVAPTWQWFGD